jgi:hypothetical protein
VWIGREITSLAAFHVRVESEAANVDALQQDEPGGWTPVPVGSCKQHRVGLAQYAGIQFFRAIVELDKELDRIADRCIDQLA